MIFKSNLYRFHEKKKKIILLNSWLLMYIILNFQFNFSAPSGDNLKKCEDVNIKEIREIASYHQDFISYYIISNRFNFYFSHHRFNLLRFSLIYCWYLCVCVSVCVHSYVDIAFFSFLFLRGQLDQNFDSLQPLLMRSPRSVRQILTVHTS